MAWSEWKNVGGGELTLIHNDFKQLAGATTLEWTYTATEDCNLLVHAVCVHDGNGGSNTVTATKNGETVTPTLTMQGIYYSLPLTNAYMIEVKSGDVLHFIIKTTQAETSGSGARSFVAITAYSC